MPSGRYGTRASLFYVFAHEHIPAKVNLNTAAPQCQKIYIFTPPALSTKPPHYIQYNQIILVCVAFLVLPFRVSKRYPNPVLGQCLKEQKFNLCDQSKNAVLTRVSSVDGSKPGNSLVENTLKGPPNSSESTGTWGLPGTPENILKAR